MGGGSKRNRGPRHLSSVVRLDRKSLWTLNAVPRKAVYGESLRKFSGKEYRRWEPHRSKLAAAMLRTAYDPALLLPNQGETVLYLGAGHGTSVSHLHDHLCGQDNRLGGRLVSVDLAPRCLGAARRHEAWGVLIPRKVNWLFQDVAQAGQVDIFIAACRRFLAPGGMGLLSLKAASERWTGEGEAALFGEVEQRLIDAGYDVAESIELTGYEDHHRLFVVHMTEG